MAFVDTPTLLWPSYASNGTNITIPIAALDGLTAAEADATTGDWRSIMLSLISTAHRYYDALPTADKPLAFVAADPTVQSVTSGSFAGAYRTAYTFTIMATLGTPDVVNEPS
jgi:hypothetical protein